MSHQQISRNPDLKRLRDEGYEVETAADAFKAVYDARKAELSKPVEVM